MYTYTESYDPNQIHPWILWEINRIKEEKDPLEEYVKQGIIV